MTKKANSNWQLAVSRVTSKAGAKQGAVKVAASEKATKDKTRKGVAAKVAKKPMSREEIMAAIRKCARELGRIPTRHELKERRGVKPRRLLAVFGTLKQAVVAAGLEPIGPGFQASREELLKDWARVARRLSRVPTKAEFSRDGRYSTMPYTRLWRWWRDVAEEFRAFAQRDGAKGEWADVAQMIEKQYPTPGRQAAAAAESRRVEPRREKKSTPAGGRPLYGAPISLPGMGRAPMNEMGVLFAFAMLAHKLGFEVMLLQPKRFPDCEALREVYPGRWVKTRIEFEFESRNFLEHGHDATKCDVIVCWRHNWPEKPAKLEVIELSREIG
jgi:hypothetical protein